MNYIKLLKNFFDTTNSNIKYHVFTKVLPVTALSYSLFYIYKYKLYDFKNPVYTITEGNYFFDYLRKKHR